MALKSVIESLDDVDEKFHSEYVQRGDVFVLDVEDFGKHPGAVRLKTSLDNLDKTKKTLETDLTSLKARLEGLPDDFSADTYKQLLEGKGDKSNADIEELKRTHTEAVKALQTKHQQELADRDNRIGTLASTLENDSIERALRSNLLEVGVHPELLDGALLVVRPYAKAAKDDAGKVTSVVMDTELGETEVKDFVKEWSSGKGKPYLGKAAGPGGNGNGNPAGGGTPKGDFGGDRNARTAAIASKFPDLPAR